MTKRQISAALAALCLLIFAAACGKKKTPPPPPPPAPEATAAPAKPVINFFNAEPSSIEKGQSSILRWSVNGATEVTIDQGVGAVSPNGSRGVTPTATATYTLTASNAGGTDTKTATVTINTPPPPPPVSAAENLTAAELLARDVRDIYFDYDKSDIRAQDQATLQGNAEALNKVFTADSGFIVTIEGHCDERGSAEYNLGLGDQRAAKTKDALVALGVPADKLRTISYGKERPQCTDASEDCYQRNRRSHFSAGQ